MTLQDLISLLTDHPNLSMQVELPDHTLVPAHFHVTEVGRVQKDFIDCGGTVRHLESCVLQVWVANDFDHRLDTTKLAQIVGKARALFNRKDIPVEVEYEHGLISQYPVRQSEVTPSGLTLRLEHKHTECLAPDRCGVPLVTLSTCTTTGCC